MSETQLNRDEWIAACKKHAMSHYGFTEAMLERDAEFFVTMEDTYRGDGYSPEEALDEDFSYL